MRAKRAGKRKRSGTTTRNPLTEPSPPTRSGERAFIALRLLKWFDTHGRTNLPWQHPRTSYRVWLSEVMLQQTQVTTVVPYFDRFIAKFPDLPALAAAPLDDVLSLWSGLGYYSRARNLRRTAQICVEKHAGDLPRTLDELAGLPGIGRSTAGAILAQAHALRVPILDGNVKRVLSRWAGVRGWAGTSAVAATLWRIAEIQTPADRVVDYTQAIMDLGATLCVRARPRCTDCPLARDCVAFSEGLTALLPERKPARAIPTRRTIMLVLRDTQGRVLLERRPPTGVWAGLWSLPEAGDRTQAGARVRRHARGKHTPEFKTLQPFVHGFSHYRLEVTPLLAQLAVQTGVADDAGSRWLLPADAAALGLPAPVRKLLAALERTNRPPFRSASAGSPVLGFQRSYLASARSHLRKEHNGRP